MVEFAISNVNECDESADGEQPVTSNVSALRILTVAIFLIFIKYLHIEMFKSKKILRS